MRYRLLIFSVLSMFAFASCEDYLDVNTDPNNPTKITPELSLPVAQNYTARWLQGQLGVGRGPRSVNTLGNMLMYNWSESAGFSWYNDEFLYRANSTTFYEALFNYAYTRPLKQYRELEGYDPAVYGAYVGISKIMQAYHFQILVDLYGDIPYAEALGRSNNATPAYDEASAVYDNLLLDIAEGITLINDAEAQSGSELPGADDLMFAGDLTQWKQFANTLKLRIITRAAEAKGDAWVSEKLTAIKAEGSGYITSDVTIQSGYIDEENKQNPFWESFGEDPTGAATMNNNATSATDYILEYLDKTSDSRIDFLYEKPETGHLGVPQGIVADPDVYAPKLVSNIGPGLLVGPDQPSVILSLAERYFNQAELALSGSGDGDPEALYNAGVTASFVSLGVTGSVDDDNDPATPEVSTTAQEEAAAYLSQGLENVNYASSSNKLEAIITQKWLAVNGITAEQSWFDWVRTGFPKNLPVSQEAPNLVRPVRLSYPASELGGNSANVPAQPNVFTSKIFWAK